eukprot:Blabericola_migrator_1__3896@NODE_2179_length_3163_cov_43_647933_g1373_i0_p2_GENE_NODE_2179_length_3163_cov_43_647933_g1373_i0NODE_2179_length_3163_cov_43_647933_g1373_i0_p2_ORF_typecomplete_len224_score45_54_NODE_2179_length_3163_cov_43_647933_g1373_i019342605
MSGLDSLRLADGLSLVEPMCRSQQLHTQLDASHKQLLDAQCNTSLAVPITQRTSVSPTPPPLKEDSPSQASRVPHILLDTISARSLLRGPSDVRVVTQLCDLAESTPFPDDLIDVIEAAHAQQDTVGQCLSAITFKTDNLGAFYAQALATVARARSMSLRRGHQLYLILAYAFSYVEPLFMEPACGRVLQLLIEAREEANYTFSHEIRSYLRHLLHLVDPPCE